MKILLITIALAGILYFIKAYRAYGRKRIKQIEDQADERYRLWKKEHDKNK